MTSGSLEKKRFLASRDVIISSQFAVQIWRGFFTLGDGCWLPIFGAPRPANFERTKTERTVLGMSHLGIIQACLWVLSVYFSALLQGI